MAARTHLHTYGRVDPRLLRTEFSGKSVLITGGGSGIGAAIAKSFAEAGIAEILLVGRTESKLQSRADELASFKDTKISIFKVDISSKTDVQALFESLKTSPDFLINNAGFLPSPTNFIHADLDEYWSGFTTNVYGTALATQSFLRHRETLNSSHSPAAVVTVNSGMACQFLVPGLSAYGSSKAALARWSELVSVDVPENTARFISIHPGGILTALGVKSGLPIGKDIPVTDLKLAGDFTTWVASEEAGFLNGRFVWVNWDVDDLVQRKDEILSKNLYRATLTVHDEQLC
jgi:NAD(P)-dependent dehydrogenase (short-subunit alcohol dehydrogenase family)